jgi:hypothetical protein
MISNKKNRIMETALVIELALLCVFVCGCNKHVNEGRMNAGLINAYNDTAMENAIIAQHSLFSYHFINNSDQLNELGRRDLSILTKHFKEYPGPLNISRDGISENLYKARVAYISKQLKKDGIDTSKLTISDGLPGGSGMASTEVVQIREADQKARNERRQIYPKVESSGSSK